MVYFKTAWRWATKQIKELSDIKKFVDFIVDSVSTTEGPQSSLFGPPEAIDWLITATADLGIVYEGTAEPIIL